MAAPLHTRARVAALTTQEARALSGAQIDAINLENLHVELGSRWLMREQECEYLPTNVVQQHFDVAVLMVDDRQPQPYRVRNTPFASPSSWGMPRLALNGDFLPPRWGPLSATRAAGIAAAAVEAASRRHFADAKDGNSLGSEDDGDAEVDRRPDDNGSDDDTDARAATAPHGRTALGGEAANDGVRVGAFQLALIINHIYASLHHYAFYLERPCVNGSVGVDGVLWRRSVSAHLRRGKRGSFTPRHQKYLKRAGVCAALPASHQLGPFPPRAPAWSKLAALRRIARRHAYVLYLDSDAFVTHVWRPLAPLIASIGMANADTWLAVASEYPPQKLRGDSRAGLANSGVLLLAGLPVAGPGVMTMLEDWIWPFRGVANAAFAWPYEQNALSSIVLPFYKHKVKLLPAGCPLNSPFGALVRHYVGGTPERSVYMHEHRASWLLEALRCTVGLLIAAAEQAAGSAGDTTTDAGGVGGERAAAPRQGLLDGSAGAALRQQAGCAPNEPRLVLNVSGGACAVGPGGIGHAPRVMYRGVRPVGGSVLARVPAAWWRVCCALCHAHAACGAWAFDEGWPADTRNCVLLDGFEAAEKASDDQRVLGRMARRRGRRREEASGGTAREEEVRAYAVPEVGPWV